MYQALQWAEKQQRQRSYISLIRLSCDKSILSINIFIIFFLYFYFNAVFNHSMVALCGAETCERWQFLQFEARTFKCQLNICVISRPSFHTQFQVARCFDVWKEMVPLCIAAKKCMWKRFIQFNLQIKVKPTSSNKLSAL